MAQLSYKYQTPQGVAGGLFDLAPYSIDSRANGETDADIMKFGMGVVQGATPGLDILVPAAADTADKFEGLALSGFTSEMDMSGEVKLRHLQTVGVMRYGKAWARVASGLTIQYGEPLYLVKNGADAGLFTNVSGADAFAVNGRFIGAVDSAAGAVSRDIAPIEIYNQLP